MTKAMRLLSVLALIVAGTMMIGCSSEYDGLNEQPQVKQTTDKQATDSIVTLTTTISRADDSTQTRALTEAGVKTFVPNEKVAVVFETQGGYSRVDVMLSEGEITNGGKTATISFNVSGSYIKENGFVKYIYPAAMAKDNGDGDLDKLYNEQDGTLSTLSSTFDYARFDGNFEGTQLPKGKLTNQLALCKFTIKDGEGTDITSQLTKLTIKNGTDVYYVNTSSLSNIWVALKPITSGKIDIYAAKNTYLYRKTVSGKTLAVNTLTPIKVTAPLVPGALSGLFSVNDNHDLVYFSQGNLRAVWHNSTWANWYFADYQHEFIKNYQGNVSVGNPLDGNIIDLFGWSTNYGKNYYGINASTDNDPSDENYVYQGNFYDWGNTIIQNGDFTSGCLWRTLSFDEFRYIFETRSASTISGKANARFLMVHFPGDSGNNGKIHVAGVVLFPDNYKLPALEHTTITNTAVNMSSTYGAEFSWEPVATLDWGDWGKMEAAGAVFLPNAGSRNGTAVKLYDYLEVYPWGGYWTSTKGINDDTGNYESWCAGTLQCEWYEDKYQVVFVDATSRHTGLSVRLVGPGAYNK